MNPHDKQYNLYLIDFPAALIVGLFQMLFCWVKFPFYLFAALVASGEEEERS
jgi:hypothetical protein